MSRRLRIGVLNQVAEAGLRELPASRYDVGVALAEADAIVLRSAKLHDTPMPAGLLAIARAGAGTNNIPVAAMSERGVPVFNAPGANANAVKELVLAGMLMSARHLGEALQHVRELDTTAPDLEVRIAQGKKRFAGTELSGRTLGVIGLGRIGSLVAQAAIDLGMSVVGHDPSITVDAAWSLPAQVRRAADVPALMRACDYVSVHVPLLEATRYLVGAQVLGQMRPHACLLNFSRAEVVDEAAVLAALDAGRMARYVCDFPTAANHRHPKVISLPHLGASTGEAEENCAIMVVRQLRDYLEHGNVRNAVNFPMVDMARESPWRLAIAHANMPNMVGQISTEMAGAQLNIHNMINKSRGEVAYTLVDVDSAVNDRVIAALKDINGVLAVRYLLLDPPTS
ncbi:MAG: phosphoglycerate dehydrogenase [Burkholderiaceae bacterium]